MAEPVFDTLLLSDLHLGSEVSRARDALYLLKHTNFRRLVLLGDIFNDLNFARLNKEHWQFLSYIRKLSNPKRSVQVIWVEGNHDNGLTAVMSHLVGVAVYQEFAWTFDSTKHLAIHGHQFDRFVSHNRLLSSLGASFFLQLQKLDSRHQRFSRFLDRLNTAWLRMSTAVASGALAYAKARGITRVFCGHTHVAMQAIEDGVCYYNTGSWVGRQPTYVTIDDSGVHLRHFLETRHDRDPLEIAVSGRLPQEEEAGPVTA